MPPPRPFRDDELDEVVFVELDEDTLDVFDITCSPPVRPEVMIVLASSVMPVVTGTRVGVRLVTVPLVDVLSVSSAGSKTRT